MLPCCCRMGLSLALLYLLHFYWQLPVADVRHDFSVAWQILSDWSWPTVIYCSAPPVSLLFGLSSAIHTHAHTHEPLLIEDICLSLLKPQQWKKNSLQPVLFLWMARYKITWILMPHRAVILKNMDKIHCDICTTKIRKKDQIFYLFLIKSKN